METRKLTELKPNPLNPRGEVVHDVPLRELAASIKSQGLLQPILITPSGTIVAGHRRVVAARLAGLTEVLVIVKELNEAEQLQVMLVENIQRNDLTVLQTAKAYRQLTERGLSVDLIANAIGVTKRSVSEHLMIFRLPVDIQPYFDNGSLGLRSAVRLVELNPEEQLRIAREAVEKGWGEVKISFAIHRLKTPKPDLAPTSSALLDRIFERVDNGCYTPEAISKCDECGCDVFPSLSLDEIRAHLDELVRQKRCRWTPQGGRKDNQRGPQTMLCMPVDNEIGSFVGAVSSFQRQPKPRA